MIEDKLVIGRIAFAKSACIDWISDHSKMVLIFLASLLLISFAFFQFTDKMSRNSLSDFIEAQLAYSSWVSGQANSQELFKKLERPLKKNSELQVKFGALVAQRFLTMNDPAQAEPFAKQLWKRTGHLLSSHYIEFSKTSLLISQSKFENALEAARTLRLKMNEDAQFCTTQDQLIRSGRLLYAYNLIRIAALEKEAGSFAGELEAWNEFLANAGWEPTTSPSKMFDPEAYSIFQKTLRDGKLSFYDYVMERKGALLNMQKSEV